MRQFTELEQARVLKVLKEQNGKYNEAATKLGITVDEIQSVDMVANPKRYNYTPEGKGPVHLQKYIVAIRDSRALPQFDNSDIRIIKARELYEQGVIEMATGRDGFNAILYAIPRHEKGKERKGYFDTPQPPTTEAA